jgi:TetR/AcrR family transcriptional regulator, repressor for uid operon
VRKVDPVKHEEKRAEILAAAERCFARSGFHGATIAQICGEAGISPGHLYHYFASKEAIIGAITSAGLEYVKARFAEVAEDEHPIRSLVAEFERLKALNRAKSGVLLDVLAEASRNPVIGKILQDTSEEMRRLLAEFLRRGQAHGQIDPDLDADVAAAMLISMIDSSKTLLIRAPTIDPKRSADVLDKMITRFLSRQVTPEAARSLTSFRS